MSMGPQAPDAKLKHAFAASSNDQILGSLFELVNNLHTSMMRMEAKVDSLAVSLQEMRESIMRPGLQNPSCQEGLNGYSPLSPRNVGGDEHDDHGHNDGYDDDDDDDDDDDVEEGFVQDVARSSFIPSKLPADDDYDSKDENENIKNHTSRKKSGTLSDKNNSGIDDESEGILYTEMTVFNKVVNGEIDYDDEDISLDSTEKPLDDAGNLTDARSSTENKENFLNMANKALNEERFVSDRHEEINKADARETNVEELGFADAADAYAKERRHDTNNRKINEDELTLSDMSDDETRDDEEIHNATNSTMGINMNLGVEEITKVALISNQELKQPSLDAVADEEKLRVKPGRFLGVHSSIRPEDNRFVFFSRTEECEEISPGIHPLSSLDVNFRKTKRSDEPSTSKKDTDLAENEVDEISKSETPKLSASPEITDEVEEEIEIPNNRPNNQASFGLKNLQGGNIDNRFAAEGHDDSHGMYVVASAGRSFCSNAQLIQNCLKPQEAMSAESSGSHAEQLEQRHNTEASPRFVRSEFQGDDLSTLDVRPFGSFNSRQGSSGDRQTGSAMLTGDQIEALISSQRTEAQNSRDPKSLSGIDTVILLDTSASMDGKPLKQAKSAIFNFLDGLEFNAIEYDLEENVAIVTFGKENKIVQHFTNNFDLIKENIENLQAAGPSPLWIGMALALTEIATRGGALTVGHMTIKPRLLVITDGYVTSKYCVFGEDTLAADTQAVTEIEELLTNKFQESVSSVSCLTVDPHCADVVHKLSSGRVFSDDDIVYLAQFFRTQNEASNLLAECSQRSLSRRQLVERVRQMGLTTRSMEDILKIVSVTDEDSDDETEEPEAERPPSPANAAPELDVTEVPDESAEHFVGASSRQVNQQIQESVEFVTSSPATDPVKNVSEAHSWTKEGKAMVDLKLSLRSNTSGDSDDIVDDLEGPPFGTPVKPHPGSPRFQDRHFIQGATIGLRKNGLVKVAWDDGSIERVQYGVNGEYDIVGLPEEECINNVMKTGARVQRGPDWKWGDQDGGPGHIGVVTQTSENKKVIYVIWPHGGQGNYRFGHHKKYDIELSSLPSQHMEEDTASLPSPEKKFPCWQYLSGDDWRPFSPEVNQICEEMLQKNTAKSFLVNIQQLNFRITLTSLQARNTNTGESFPIRRIEITNEELQKLFETPAT